ncbi:hypothetical protein TELCIR_19004, partial [Teladorsagia circumcincta]
DLLVMRDIVALPRARSPYPVPNEWPDKESIDRFDASVDPQDIDALRDEYARHWKQVKNGLLHYQEHLCGVSRGPFKVPVADLLNPSIATMLAPNYFLASGGGAGWTICRAAAPSLSFAASKYKIAAAAGFRQVEVSLPYSEKAEDLKSTADSLGLTHTLINAPTGTLVSVQSKIKV